MTLIVKSKNRPNIHSVFENVFPISFLKMDRVGETETYSSSISE